MRCTAFATLICLILTAQAQSPDSGKQIYSASQDSVFLIYLSDASGTPQALGSGFLVAPNLLVTNAHVASAGTPVLVMGPVRIPLKVVSLDTENDLAILSFTADLTSKPLQLSADPAKPGEQVFAIGNPEGLEKSISQGIVSAVRTRDGRELIQITAPISHGSSGGPVFNAKGEVIGVAVGMLESGQNLNFAVPAKFVSELLTKKNEPAQPFSLSKALTAADDLQASLNATEYSSDSGSTYQTTLQRLHDTLKEIVQNSDDQDSLRRVSCFAVSIFDDDQPVAAAHKLVNAHPSAENEALLAYVLYVDSLPYQLAASLAKGDTEKAKAQAELDRWLDEAASTAQRSVRVGKGNALLLAGFVLAGVKDNKGEYADAIAINTHLAAENVAACGNDLTTSTLSNLVSENETANHPEDAEKWFKVYASKFTPTPYDWDKAGDRRWKLSDMDGSAKAYEAAASAASGYAYDYCYAAKAGYLASPRKDDLILSDGRACVEASLKSSDSDKPYFDETLPLVYSDMSEILEQRGVYQSALQYAKEAVSLKPDYSWGFSDEAEVYYDLRQFDECISAAEAAIRASDGKFPTMHFRLGACYFETKNYSMAENSFRISAEADKTDFSSAYNLALSLLNEGHEVDGKQWLREALKRSPDDETRTKIVNLLKP